MISPEAPRWILAGVMMAWASWHDLRSRRVPNRVWIPYAAFAGFFTLTDLLAGSWKGAAVGVVVALLAYLMFRAHLFGGADAKALMVLAFLLPGLLEGLVPTALLVLFIACSAVIGLPLVFVAINLVKGELRLPAGLLGIRMSLDQVRSRHYWPMERVVGGKVVWRLWQRLGTDPGYDELEAAGVLRPWVTPKIPLTVLLFVGVLGAAALFVFGLSALGI